MKELRQKTFWTILGILTAILIVSLALINLQNYQRERESILRNLRMFDDTGRPDRNPGPFEIRPQGRGDLPKRNTQPGNDFGDILIMDHEVYTVFLKDGAAERIISHGNRSDDFDIEQVAKHIAESNQADRESVDNLFFSGYSYRYRHPDLIVVVNHREISAGLRQFLLISLLLFLLLEAAIVFLSRLITQWIVKPAVEAFQKQKDFIADASHELKTPLAVIMASSEELDQAGITEEKRQSYLNNIRSESERMNRLIQELLELSRLESADLKTSRQEEDLSRLIEKMVLVFEAVAFERDVTMETDIPEGISFHCDKDEMEKMLSTILDNAVKHSYPGSSIRVSARVNAGRIVIRVTNRGDPIPEEDLERIFERFYRADKARSRSENRYGLGLAIAKRIARNHNGDIRAFCEQNEITFEITLSE
ncbi:MAG: HAMP domain-containing histidine kinase [Lachnospiraceae bacterium]|nr:HAMP domain-containing histidine kinase [Lachnospiraceae bacterium]